MPGDFFAFDLLPALSPNQINGYWREVFLLGFEGFVLNRLRFEKARSGYPWLPRDPNLQRFAWDAETASAGVGKGSLIVVNDDVVNTACSLHACCDKIGIPSKIGVVVDTGNPSVGHIPFEESDSRRLAGLSELLVGQPSHIEIVNFPECSS